MAFAKRLNCLVVGSTCLFTFLIAAPSKAADSYNASTGVLTIPYVADGGLFYKDVSITLDKIISYSAAVQYPSIPYDTYNSTNNQLTIPVVNVGSASYYNVVTTVGRLLALGPSCALGFVACYPSLWAQYSWTKPTTATPVSSAAMQNFYSYIQTSRSPNASVQVIAQAGVDPIFVDMVQKAGTLVAKAFSYPALTKPLIELIALDRSFYETTLIANGFSRDAPGLLATNWDSGAPAWGGLTLNSYNYTVISKTEESKLNNTQTPGHEYFHAVQAGIAAAGYNSIPKWFIEGPAMFVGLLSADYLALRSYSSSGRKSQTDRCSALFTQKLTLAEHQANTPNVVDPYAIGEIATELLVANVGMQKVMDIYSQVKITPSDFSAAFLNATGVKLADFYTMFEEVRGTLGCPKV
jgi:hypothetical protein